MVVVHGANLRWWWGAGFGWLLVLLLVPTLCFMSLCLSRSSLKAFHAALSLWQFYLRGIIIALLIRPSSDAHLEQAPSFCLGMVVWGNSGYVQIGSSS